MIEMIDDLRERERDCEREMRECFLEYLEENEGMKDFDEFYQAEGCERVNEIVEHNTPISKAGVDGLYFLHGEEFEEAYENARIGTGEEQNYKQVAIYCYLEEKTMDELNWLQEKWEETENKEKAIKVIKNESESRR